MKINMSDLSNIDVFCTGAARWNSGALQSTMKELKVVKKTVDCWELADIN